MDPMIFEGLVRKVLGSYEDNKIAPDEMSELGAALSRKFGSDLGAFNAIGRSYRGEPGKTAGETAEIEKILGHRPDQREVMDMDRYFEGLQMGTRAGGLGALTVPILSAGWEAVKGSGAALPNIPGMARNENTSPASVANVMASVHGASDALRTKLASLFGRKQ